jgi:hypothetical protein
MREAEYQVGTKAGRRALLGHEGSQRCESDTTFVSTNSRLMVGGRIVETAELQVSIGPGMEQKKQREDAASHRPGGRGCVGRSLSIGIDSLQY